MDIFDVLIIIIAVPAIVGIVLGLTVQRDLRIMHEERMGRSLKKSNTDRDN